MSITSIIKAITSITCITASILKQCPSPSPSRLSHVLQLQSYNNVHYFHHHRHHVIHMHYSFNPIKRSITSITIAITCNTIIFTFIKKKSSTCIAIAITSITCITASILKQCPSPLQSRLSSALQLRFYNSVHHFHHHGHHIYHMYYNFNPITKSISIANTSITCITL